MADLDGQLQVLHLLVLEHFLHVEDRAARHTGLVEDLDPRGTGPGDGRLLQLGVAGLAVLRAILRRPEARIVDQVPDLQRLAETAVHVLAGGGDVHVAVGGLEHAGRNAGRVIVARLWRDLLADEPARRLEVEHAHHRLQQRGVDPLALAGALALEQRHQDAVRQEHAGGEVGHGDADAHRALARQASDRHQPAEALGDLIVTGAIAIGAALAEARDAGVDDPRVDRAERLVVDAEAVLDVGPEVLDDDVGPGGELLEDLDAARVLEVERHRALVAVQVLEVELVAGEVVLLLRLDLDDVGAHLGELAHAGGTGSRAGEVDDGVGRQREAHGLDAITAMVFDSNVG